MTTGHAGLASAAVCLYNSAQYASERIQGRPLTNPKAGRVPIIQHEDVRRMLMFQKAHIEAFRALIFYTYWCLDLSEHTSDPELAKKLSGYVEISTPVIKAYCSDMGFQSVSEAMQVYGGYGFSEEYPIAQQLRDCRIYPIWEGTNFIQAMDLVGRKWMMKKGQAFASLLQEIRDFIAAKQEEAAGLGFAKEMANLQKALDSYTAIQMAIGGYFGNKQYGMLPLHARKILTATAQLYCGYLMLEQGLIAKKRADELGSGHYDYNFYYGKTLSVKYYLQNVVPNVWATLEIVQAGDTSVIDAPPEIFEY
jgi:hypothetical protein